MPIPDYQAIMLPLLRLTSDGKEWRLREAKEQIIKHFSLTEDEVAELLLTTGNLQSSGMG